MTFYRDSNFLNPIAGNPLQVSIGTDIYIKVFTPAADWSTEMRLKSCYVKPARNSTEHLTSYLIKDGCEVDVNTHLIWCQHMRLVLYFDDSNTHIVTRAFTSFVTQYFAPHVTHIRDVDGDAIINKEKLLAIHLPTVSRRYILISR
ncbi:hypothetical protein MAR_019542 [Mya arenaria]|uniref:ZP-C domain-containing protein n=1 Tax=Mya arenaria TaxID=6604 RepID=A0ABY7E2E9_MYAAR|nr:hypothetical protein MAR_019542 [Mya arenaria]